MYIRHLTYCISSVISQQCNNLVGWTRTMTLTKVGIIIHFLQILYFHSSFFLLFAFSPISQHLPTLFLHFFYSFSYLINILTFQYSIYNLSTLSQHILNIFFEMFMNFLSLVLKFLNIFCDTVNDSKILSEKKFHDTTFTLSLYFLNIFNYQSLSPYRNATS